MTPPLATVTLTHPTVALANARAAYRAAYERWQAVRDDLAADVGPVWEAVDAAERNEMHWRAQVAGLCVWEPKRCPEGGPSICDWCAVRRRSVAVTPHGYYWTHRKDG